MKAVRSKVKGKEEEMKTERRKEVVGWQREGEKKVERRKQAG